jgi:DNA polymerase III subunit gamma/tau
MSSLYRKYRPSQFGEVVGQGHIVRILEEEVKKPQPSHAFLFAGSRGTGKTTIARIFAQNIGTAPEDIYEIDAASNTSVDDIRLLNEAVYTLPLMSKFKVYILDEVHMLSKSAFNAFLKTLEEPPKHVIFILATTELHKIPETIISRCQVFHFAKPTIDALKNLIIDVAGKEGVKIEEKAAEIIAMVGNGSFRDTLSTLQSVVGMAQGGEEGSAAKKGAIMTVEEVENIISVPPHQLVASFVDAVLKEKNLAAGISVLKKVHESDMDVKIFADLVMSELRTFLLSEAGGSIGAKNKEQVSAAIRMLDLILSHREQIGKTFVSVLPLELALFKFFG